MTALAQRRLWWAALALLILNDHVLKGALAGTSLGGLSGKLSDFAGLLVTPALCAAALGAALPRTSLWRARAMRLGFGLPVAVFVAINASPHAARTLEAITHSLGVPWRIWCDPTDLLALVVLPSAWRLASSAPRPERLPARSFGPHAAVGGALRPWAPRMAAIAGGLASIATSLPPEVYSTGGYLLNEGSERIEVRVRHYAGSLDCDALGAWVPAALRDAHLEPAVTYALDRGSVVPLDLQRRASPCAALLLEAEGLAPHAIWWSDSGRWVTVPTRISGDDSRPQSGVLLHEGDSGSWTAVASGEGQGDATVVPRAEVEHPVCAPDPAPRFLWSFEVAPGRFPLTRIDRDAGGCTHLESERDLPVSAGPSATPNEDAEVGTSAPLHASAVICAPEGAVDFAPGETIDVQQRGTSWELTSETHTLWLLEVGEEGNGVFEPQARIVARDAGCELRSTPCGGLARDIALEVDGLTLTSGETRSVSDGGETRRYALGAATRVLAAPTTCLGADALVGARSALVAWKESTR